MSRTFEQILTGLNKDLSQMFGDSTVYSYAMPERINGRLVDNMFLYVRGGMALEARRPFGFVVVDGENGRILCYQDAKYADFMQGEVPLDTMINYRLPEKMGVKEFKQVQAELRELYEKVRLFAFSEAPGDEEKAQLRRYLELFDKLSPAALKPYYEAIGKQFYAWVKTVA